MEKRTGAKVSYAFCKRFPEELTTEIFEYKLTGVEPCRF